MKIFLKKINFWIDPESLAHYFSSLYGEEGLSWLDSNGSENGKWSYLGVNPTKIISCRGINSSQNATNPFEKLSKIKKGFWIGWLNYEAASWLEPNNFWNDNNMNTLWIASYDPIIKFDLAKKELFIEGSNIQEIEYYEKIIKDGKSKEYKPNLRKNLKFNFSKVNLEELSDDFQQNITKIKSFIKKGDIFQANISTNCEVEANSKYKYLDIYSKIRKKLKAPFSGIIVSNLKNAKEGVISTSPERFLKLTTDGYVETRPIKGTRPRNSEAKADALNAIDLITNEKDRAENIMIVDLLRNDLGKVCETGSILVPELLKLESFPKVHHLTSVIRGKLKKDNTWVDLLKACWPGGSITGAPKIRACQRIYELEKDERGPYCGSFLKINWDGEFDSNILIRSFILSENKIKIYAGCGIVLDSIPQEENKELYWKLIPLIDSLK